MPIIQFNKKGSLLHITWPRSVNRDDVVLAMTTLVKYLELADRPFGVVSNFIDADTSDILSKPVRDEIKKFMTNNEALIHKKIACWADVTKSSFVRVVARGVRIFASTPYPGDTFSTVEEAEKWALLHVHT